MKRFWLFLTLALVALTATVVVGCGDDKDKDKTTASDSEDTYSQDDDKAPRPGAEVDVSIKDIKFNPKTIKVRVGDEITWTNEDTIVHNVTAESGADFKSGDLNQGDTFDFEPTKAGTIAYVCTIHPGQDGTIEVAES